MPILSDLIQGTQGQQPGGIMDILKNIQKPPPDPEEQKTKARIGVMGQATELFSDSLGGMSDEAKKPLVSAFMKNILSPPTQSLAEGTVKGTEEPTKTPQALPVQPTADTTEGKPNMLLEVLKRIGVPGLAAILGSTGAMPLAGAAGLGTGFVKGFGEAEELGLEREKITATKKEKAAREEKADLNRAWNQATQVAKQQVDEFGQPIPLTAKSVQRLADSILKLKQEGLEAQRKQKGIVEKAITGKFQVPKDAPSAQGKPDGSLLKDASGKAIARAVNGQWQSIQ